MHALRNGRGGLGNRSVWGCMQGSIRASGRRQGRAVGRCTQSTFIWPPRIPGNRDRRSTRAVQASPLLALPLPRPNHGPRRLTGRSGAVAEPPARARSAVAACSWHQAISSQSRDACWPDVAVAAWASRPWDDGSGARRFTPGRAGEHRPAVSSHDALAFQCGRGSTYEYSYEYVLRTVRPAKRREMEMPSPATGGPLATQSRRRLTLDA